MREGEQTMLVLDVEVDSIVGRSDRRSSTGSFRRENVKWEPVVQEVSVSVGVVNSIANRSDNGAVHVILDALVDSNVSSNGRVGRTSFSTGNTATISDTMYYLFCP